ncbi:MAG: MFS transporter [Firmicutes bacterium]|nr:MFS transporter [Bacillota bacterium]MDY6161570.1 MFS transporter [Candidatus Faecousia sp.]
MKNIITQYAGLKREVYVLFVGRIVTAMGSFVWPMLTFLLTTKLGFSDGVATMFIATAGLISLPLALLGGKLADRFPRKNIIMIFDCLTVALYVLAAILPIGYHTAAIIFVASLFQTVESPAYDALNADYSTTDQREKAFSLSYLGYNLGYVFGASMGGILFEFHTNLAFLLNGLSIFVSTALIFFFVKPENAISDTGSQTECYSEYEKPVEESLPILAVLKQRSVVLAILLIGCFASMSSNTVGILLPLQLKGQMGQHGAAVYGYLNSLNGFVVILFTPLLTMVLKRLTEIPKSILGMGLFLAGMVLFTLGSPLWVLFVGMFVFTLGEVVSVLGNNPYTSRRIPASHRGRIGGVTSVLYSVFFTLIQYGISFVLMIAEGNYRLLWLVFIGCGLASMALYALAYPADKKRFPNLYPKGVF